MGAEMLAASDDSSDRRAGGIWRRKRSGLYECPRDVTGRAKQDQGRAGQNACALVAWQRAVAWRGWRRPAVKSECGVLPSRGAESFAENKAAAGRGSRPKTCRGQGTEREVTR